MRAAAEVLQVLRRLGRHGCVIGGLALQRWGQPRFTSDADLTVLAPFGSEAPLVDQLIQEFRPRIPTARQHALDRRVLLLIATNGVSIDLSLAALPFEEEVLSHATRWRKTDDVWLETCSAEDLVIYKLVAARDQDLVDVTGIVRRQGTKLDAARIRHWGAQFAELKEDPDLLRPFEEARQRAGLQPL